MKKEISDAEFTRTVKEFLEKSSENGNRLMKISDGLRVSVPTIKRWANGENLPHQAVRNNLIQHIHAMIMSDKLESDT